MTRPLSSNLNGNENLSLAEKMKVAGWRTAGYLLVQFCLVYAMMAFTDKDDFVPVLIGLLMGFWSQFPFVIRRRNA